VGDGGCGAGREEGGLAVVVGMDGTRSGIDRNYVQTRPSKSEDQFVVTVMGRRRG
jgi:hypothetical protein